MKRMELTEDEMIEVAYKVSREIGPKYRFGYHSNEDMVQQGVFKAWEVIKVGKFKPRADKDLVRQLSAFLRVHIRNRLSNFRRDHSCRYTNRDSLINQAKYNIMHPLQIYNQNLKEDFFVQQTIDRNELHDCLEYIITNLEENLLVDFNVIKDGGKLSISRRKKLIEAIQFLFQEAEEEEEVKDGGTSEGSPKEKA